MRPGYRRDSFHSPAVGGPDPLVLVCGASSYLYRLTEAGLQRLKGPQAVPGGVAVSPSGRRFLWRPESTRTQRLLLCEAETGEVVHEANVGTTIRALAVLDDETWVEHSWKQTTNMAEPVGQLTVYRAGRATRLAQVKGGRTWGLAASADGSRVAWTDGDTVRAYAVPDSLAPAGALGPVSEVPALAFSPDGRVLAVAEGATLRFLGRDGALDLPAPARAMRYHPDGAWLFVGLEDGRVLALDARTLQTRATLPGHRTPIQRLQHAAGALWVSDDEGATSIWTPAAG